ncbi:type V CRISPR-associated protein Cas4 [Peptostreptococcaceae bacterium OttesenSCG-928-C18]|nr:type V CRISPR-associated protein Cas4 [Peptostreptococcaceae bacterium OttesenSCG-928-C18]
MEPILKISNLNDFIFCPASIYYHGMYEELERSVYQEIDQIRGSFVHETIDKSLYSTSKEILQGIEVYTDKYKIIGKIDLYDIKKETLVERKNKITTIYDGYIFQLYAQYFAMSELGYDIKELKLYSYSDNKSYTAKLPKEDTHMFEKFEKLLNDIKNFKLENFKQTNLEKCKRCIYIHLCVNGGEKVC